MIGHHVLREKLEQHLPRITLFQTPRSVGAWQLADHLMNFHGYGDYLRLYQLDVDAVRQIQTALHEKNIESIIINIDKPVHRTQYIHELSLNALLMMLEKDSKLKAILICNEPTLDTVKSRAICFSLGLLSEQEVKEILDRKGQREKAQNRNGSLSYLKTINLEESLKPSVDAVVKAVQDKNEILFSTALKAWKIPNEGEVARDMLRSWLIQALTGWTYLSASIAPKLASDEAKIKSMLVDLDFYQGNAKISVQAAYQKYFRE